MEREDEDFLTDISRAESGRASVVGAMPKAAAPRPRCKRGNAAHVKVSEE